MGYLFLLRNIFGAGNLIFNLQIETPTELWVWEPKTKGLDNRWVSPASWMDSGRQRGGGTWEEETLAWLDCEEIKAQGFLWDLSSEKPAQAVSVFME